MVWQIWATLGVGSFVLFNIDKPSDVFIPLFGQFIVPLRSNSAVVVSH